MVVVAVVIAEFSVETWVVGVGIFADEGEESSGAWFALGREVKLLLPGGRPRGAIA